MAHPTYRSSDIAEAMRISRSFKQAAELVGMSPGAMRKRAFGDPRLKPLALACLARARRRAIDITGQRFGLVVVEYRAGVNAQGYPLWMVRCDCGQRRLARGCVLRQNPPKTHHACPARVSM